MGPSIKRYKEIIEIENNMVKNPNWQEANQLAIYKRGRRVELWGYRETTPSSGQSGTWTRDLRISSPAP